MSGPRRIKREDKHGGSSRFYEIDGQQYPSVTTVLKSISKPALIGWAARLERGMVLDAAYDFYVEALKDEEHKQLPRTWYVSSLQERIGKQQAHAKELTNASDIGSAAHHRIEWVLRKELNLGVGPEPELTGRALWAFKAWEQWRLTSRLEVELVEQTVYSKKYRYAGTMDWLGEIDDDGARIKVLGDWKTSSGIWPEMLLQNAAYVHAAIEMGKAEAPLAGCIVRLPKREKDAAFETRIIPAETQEKLLQVFLSVLDLWRWLEEV